MNTAPAARAASGGAERRRGRDRPPPAPVDPTPRLPAWQEHLIRAVAVIGLAYATYYIGWRWTRSLNWDAPWFSVTLAVAETYGLITSYFFVFTAWKLRRRTPRPAPPGLSVDVFITCYDEPLEIIRRTTIGARDIRYPHLTWVLDDGKRDEVQAMCDELGVGYVRRDGNEHAKAGNLNHALTVTSGEFVLQLDADHVPLPHILDRLLGFFDDPKVAFVQSPQDFYNTDSFTHTVNEEGRRMWEEQRIFFSLIQPGKDVWNAAFFCGSCGVLRRAAFEEIGGFSTLTITEDMETSMILHSRGWKSVYYGESLAFGLAPASAAAFHVQRLRWGQGSMQILRKLNPITRRGLTLPQRICYTASVTSYLDGVQKLVLYASPLVFFATGVFPIRVDNREFLVRFVPYLVLSVLTFELLSRGMGYLWIAERYNMAKFWTYVRAVSGFFARGKLSFNVTPKGPAHVPFRTYAPQVALMGVTVAALLWALLASRMGWISYQVPGWASAAVLLNLAWTVWNFGLAAYVVRMSLNLRQQREEHRFADRFPVRVRTVGRGGRRGRTQVALAVDLNAVGMRFRCAEPLKPGTRLEVTLPLATGTHVVHGRVLHQSSSPRKSAQLYSHGVRFQDVPLNVRDAIELHCTQHAVPIWQLQHRVSFDVFARADQLIRNSRGERRRRVRLPAVVSIEKGARGVKGAPERLALLDDISASGARLVLNEPVPPETRIRFEVPGTQIRAQGRVIFSRALHTPVGVRFAVGVRRSAVPAASRTGDGRETRMRIPQLLRRAGCALLLAAAAAPAGAQLAPVVYGATEIDAEDLRLFLVGANVSSPGTGLGWTAGISAYHLTYPAGADATASLTAVQPMAGVRYGTTTGAVAAMAGYALVDADEDGLVVGAPGGGRDGVVVQLQANHWGDGSLTGQALALYNFGAEYLWTNFRGSRRVMQTGPATGLNLGAEAGFQGGGVGDDDYQAFQAGGLVEYQLSRALRLTGVVGGKSDNRDESPGIFPYVKLEFVALPF